jgi:RNA polymerase sigma-70 factor (ECF subfamily)
MDMDEAQVAVTKSAPLVDSADRVVTHEYEQRARLLIGLAIGLGLSPEQAADVVQEAHLRLWRELHGGADIRDPAAWVGRVVYRLCMDQHRLLRRLRTVHGRLAGPEPGDSTRAIEAYEIWRLVDRLPERERAALYLRYQGDLAFARVGRILGVTESAARSYATRGIGRLRDRLARSDW